MRYDVTAWTGEVAVEKEGRTQKEVVFFNVKPTGDALNRS